MLQKVILYNFVCFKEELNMKFEEGGVYFFMGGNSTGKSSVFEAIQNCLKTTDLEQASSRCDENLDSFAVCYFRTDIFQIVSIYLDDVHKKEILKILIATDTDDRNMQVYGARRNSDLKSRSNRWELFQLKLDGVVEESLKLVKKKIKETFLNLKRDKNIDVLCICKTVSQNLKKVETPLFDEFVENFVSIQMTLPHRGINPAQSTFANANQFQASSEGADVLRRYLESFDHDDRESFDHDDRESFDHDDRESFDHYDRERFKHIFNKLSNGDVYLLQRQNREILMKIDRTGKTVPLLRLPEAVVEWHVTSVLLCGAKPITLCFEDPSRGMDKHTTKLLCDTLKQLDDEKNQPNSPKRLVIVATNDPYFISPWNLQKSYIFCDKGGECRIFYAQELLNERSEIDDKIKRSCVAEIDEKEKRFITSYPISLIWFSKRVFFVEGLSDRMFVEAIRDVIVRGETDIGSDLLERAGLNKDPHLPLLQEFLASLTIICIGGEGNKNKVEKVCNFLEMTDKKKPPVSRYYLLDENTRCGINKNLNLEFKTENPSFTELAEKGVFIWRHDLEIEVASFCHAENLKDLLTENHVPVTNDEPFKIKKKKSKGKTKSKTGKLFLESPDITEVNIHKIVSGILNAIDLHKEGQKDHKIGGTVPMFLKFIIIAMLQSNSKGAELKWNGEDYLA